ncbi:MAG: thiamine pyrophosphate-dependent enzyme [Patescibacteria group bacterium]
MNYKELAEKLKTEKFSRGGRCCAGCGIPVIVRHILAQTNNPIVASVATSCLEVTSTIYPYNAWNIPCIHNAFENAAATISGVEKAWIARNKKGKLDNNQKKIKFVAFAGDGGAYDIGLQSISGAMERGHNFLMVVYDNEGYMNTGGQRSSATPIGASTTTAPAGKVKQGKEEFKKDFMKILSAHRLPYLAQAAVHNLPDLVQKAEKALKTNGPTALVVLSPCPTVWGFQPFRTLEVSRLAFETNFWPLYEIENQKYKITAKPAVQKPIEEFLKGQKRFAHLVGKPERIKIIQDFVNKEWQRLSGLEKTP